MDTAFFEQDSQLGCCILSGSGLTRKCRELRWMLPVGESKIVTNIELDNYIHSFPFPRHMSVSLKMPSENATSFLRTCVQKCIVSPTPLGRPLVACDCCSSSFVICSRHPALAAKKPRYGRDGSSTLLWYSG